MTIALEEVNVPCAYCAKPTPPERRASGTWDWPGKGTVTNCLDCAGYIECPSCKELWDNSEGQDQCPHCDKYL